MTEEDDTDFLRLVEEYYSQKPDFARLYPGAQASNPDKSTFTADMPVHQKEEEAGGHITDQVAKESSDSTASSHGMHQSDTGASSGGVATINDHKANPGPVMSQGIGEPAGKDELKKRAEELNK